MINCSNKRRRYIITQEVPDETQTISYEVSIQGVSLYSGYTKWFGGDFELDLTDWIEDYWKKNEGNPQNNIKVDFTFDDNVLQTTSQTVFFDKEVLRANEPSTPACGYFNLTLKNSDFKREGLGWDEYIEHPAYDEEFERDYNALEIKPADYMVQGYPGYYLSGNGTSSQNNVLSRYFFDDSGEYYWTGYLYNPTINDQKGPVSMKFDSATRTWRPETKYNSPGYAIVKITYSGSTDIYRIPNGYGSQWSKWSSTTQTWGSLENIRYINDSFSLKTFNLYPERIFNFGNYTFVQTNSLSESPNVVHFITQYWSTTQGQSFPTGYSYLFQDGHLFKQGNTNYIYANGNIFKITNTLSQLNLTFETQITGTGISLKVLDDRHIIVRSNEGFDRLLKSGNTWIRAAVVTTGSPLYQTGVNSIIKFGGKTYTPANDTSGRRLVLDSYATYHDAPWTEYVHHDAWTEVIHHGSTVSYDITLPLKVQNGVLVGKTTHKLDKITYIDRYDDKHNSEASNRIELECYIDDEWLRTLTGDDSLYTKIMAATQSAKETLLTGNATISGLQMISQNTSLYCRVKDIEKIETHYRYNTTNRVPSLKLTIELYR